MTPALIDSCKSCAKLGRRQRAEQIGIGEDGLRMVEAADKIFSCEQIYACFAADRGIDLRKKRCRNLHITNASHVDCCKKSCNIADNSAAKGEKKTVAVCACGGQLLCQGFNAAEAFVRFATG